MSSSSIEFRDGMYHLSGRIDETMNLDQLRDATAFPIKLNFHRVTSINSVGARNMIALIQTLGEAEIEFHECPPHFILTLDMLPRMRGHPERVKSCYLPHVCPSCTASVDVLIEMREVRYKSSKISVPRKACESCQSVLRPDVDLNEFFLFLIETQSSTSTNS